MKTVLIIDDDPVFRSTLAQWLAENGWQVFEAEDGEDGITQAVQHRPAIVLVDLLLPRTNGFQVCRALRLQRDLIPHTRLIVTTGSGYASDRQNALDAGADEYLVKPIRPAALLMLMTRLTSQEDFAHLTHAEEEEGTPNEQVTRVKFWGVRGSVPSPGPATVHYGGNTSCVEVRADNEIIILDAGTGIRPLGLALNEEFKDRPLHLSLLISHTHWDHIQGFPFFVPAYNPRNKVRILGFEGARNGLATTLSGQMESPYFPIGMREMPGHISVEELRDLKFSIGKVTVQAIHLHHPDVCMGYRLYTSCGSIAYLPDYEPFQRLLLLPGDRTDTEMQARADYARSEDEKLTEFLRGVDVLIIDSQYDANEYPTHAGWGHSCMDDSVVLALNAKAKRLFLFHHDPDHDDKRITQMVARAKEYVAQHDGRLVVEAAREGLECVLPGGEAYEI
ncbi:MAG: response regulator [Verrucomicrobia bacterium]|nr:response regulator [Verrucomicrobiota bacterium]